MNIRTATHDDLKRIAEVHAICFPRSFSTALGSGGGRYLLRSFYKEYLVRVPELFLVAEEDGKVVGFCMGYYCEDNDYIKNYFKHNLFRIFFRCLYLGVTFNKSFYRKLFQKKGGQKVCAVQPSADSIAANRCGDLLSICVLPEHRGKGAAQSLINRYLKTLEAKSRELCYLTVDKDNSRAIAFYKRNGFELYCQRGAKMTCFCKLRGHGDCLS